jgi:hypothetical protein
MVDEPKTSIFRKESLERLSSPEQLDQLMQVVSAKSWIPLATIGSLMSIALVWSIVGRIPITATGSGVLVRPTDTSEELVNLTFFEPEIAKQIQPGMEMIIVPDPMGRSASSIVGQVVSVAPSSITTVDAARQAITSRSMSEPVEVIAQVPRPVDDASANSGGSFAPGTSTTARITLAERAPITFIFPFLEAGQ